MIDLKRIIKKNKEVNIHHQCQLLKLIRSSYYYLSKEENKENLLIMELTLIHIVEEPTAGVLTMQSMLKDKGIYAVI